MSKSLSRLYQLGNTNSEIILELDFGPEQHGVTTIMLDDSLLINNEEGPVNLTAGYSDELKNKTLYCTSTVRSYSEDSDTTRLSYRLSGGLIPLKEILEESIGGKGEIVIYTAEFFFY